MSNWYIVPSEEDLLHGLGHKYLDKVRTKSGKWRYIYYKTKHNIKKIIGSDQKRDLEAAKRATSRAVTSTKGSEYYLNKARDDGDKEWEKEVMNQRSKEMDEVIKAKRYQRTAQERYNKTLLGKLDSTISSIKDTGKKAFDSIMSLFNDTKKDKVTNRTKSRSQYLGGKSYRIQDVTSQYTPSYNTNSSGLVGGRPRSSSSKNKAMSFVRTKKRRS